MLIKDTSQPEHEAHSQARYEDSVSAIDSIKEKDMTEGINTDKVIVNAGGSGDGGGMQAAALVAALGQRNQGNDNAALIAALGSRNEKDWGPIMALMGDRHRRDDDGFGGMNGILGIAALGLIFGGGRRGGLFGGGGDDCGNGGAETRIEDNAGRLAILNAIGNTKDAVTGGFATTALALSQGFANTKDAVQASTFLLTNQINNVNQNVSEQGCQTRETVLSAQNAIIAELKNNRIADLEDKVRTLHGHEHVRESEIRISQTVNQQQQQQQQQRFDDERFRQLFGIVANIGNQVQRTRTENETINLGTMTGSGIQSAPNTQVR